MLQLTPQTRIFLAVEPADFRCGIDGLAQLCRQRLELDPFSGALVVFRNRSRTAVKILAYDGNGFWLCLRRLSQGKLPWWPTEPTRCTLTHQQLQWLLWNGNPAAMPLAADWKPVSVS
jgi:transposase